MKQFCIKVELRDVIHRLCVLKCHDLMRLKFVFHFMIYILLEEICMFVLKWDYTSDKMKFSIGDYIELIPISQN